MGRLALKVKATAPVSASTMSTQICFEDFKAIKADGTTIAIGAQCETVLYRDTNYVSINNNLIPSAPSIAIYPNPAQRLLNVDLGIEQARSIQLFNLLGEQVYTIENRTGLVEIEKNNLVQGIYMLVVQFENGIQASYKVVFN